MWIPAFLDRLPVVMELFFALMMVYIRDYPAFFSSDPFARVRLREQLAQQQQKQLLR